MIVFEGELTGKCKKFWQNIYSRLNIGIGIAVFLIITVPTIIMALTLHKVFFSLLPLLILFLVGAFLPINKKYMPKKVTIDLEEETIIFQSQETERFHMISSVERVEDYGEWYYFVFELGDRDNDFICQKSLIVQGTLDEFEKVFESKIERK